MMWSMAEGEGTAPQRLVRRDDDRMVAGVCSGLAAHFGADPLVFRLGFVALTVLGGTGIVVYLAAWALIPTASGAPPKAARRSRPFVALALLGLGAAVAVPVLVDLVNLGVPFLPGGGGGLHFEPLALAIALVTVGLVLLRPPEERVERGAAATAPAPAASFARRKRERSGLGPITLALVMLVAGGGTAAAGAGWAPLDVGQLAALSLLLTGAGLVVGAWFGRARLLIAVGILMTPVVLAASLIDFPPTGSFGSPYIHLSEAGTLEDRRVLLGQTTLDLSQYQFEEGTERVRLRVAAGSMTVIVPHEVRVDTKVSVEAGEAHVFGGHESGLGVTVEDSAGPADAPRRLEIEVVAGLGSVGIYRMNPVEDPAARDPRPDRAGRGDRKRDSDKADRRDPDKGRRRDRDKATRRSS